MLKNLLNYIQKVNKKLFSFTKLSEASILLITNVKKPASLLPSNLYQSCNELFLDRFIDCLIDNNFTRLIKTGTAKEIDLLKAWEFIFIEFCEKTNTTSFVHKFKIQKELGFNLSKLFIIETCIFSLKISYSKFLVETLKKFGYTYDFNYKDKKAFLNDIDRVDINKKSLELNILSLQKKLDDIKIEESKQPAMSHSYFLTYLAVLAKWKNQTVIRATEITVTEFITMSQLHKSERNGK